MYLDMYIEQENGKFHVYSLDFNFIAHDLGSFNTLQEARYICFENGFIME